MLNINNNMRRSLLIIALILALPGWSAAAAETPRVGADGSSLVVGGKNSDKTKASGDTLYDLLGREVQVFIYHQKNRTWPKTIVRTGGSWKTYQGFRGSLAGRGDPRLDALINKYAGAYGVDPALVRAVMRNESGFNAGAVSPKGAQGLMQLMPGTAALMGVRDPFDPEQNIAGGVGYLRRCLDRFGHNVPLAVAAYNAGPEAVARYCAVPPYQETQLFVNNVLGTYGAYNGKPGLGAPNPAVKPTAAPAVRPPKAGKVAMAKAEVAAEKSRDKDAPRRPKAKIIEVRSHKTRTKAISILRD
jgi:hypothetical protein